ncbi:replication-relaxation family protein [Actinomycetes bacterium KLBMP 9797]
MSEHRYLTTTQIASILFSSTRTCRNRLDTLRRIGFIDWFIPVLPDLSRLPVHWVPGPLSARYVALSRGERAPSLKAVKENQDSRLSAGHVRHNDGANQFGIDLLVYTRTHPQARLARWWSSTRISSKINHGARPDGHGVWTEGDRTVAYFLEHDTGTEPLGVLARKITAYRKVRAEGGPAWPVLFWLPTTTRETNLHKRLNGSARGMVLATAARDAAAEHGPAGPVWRLVGNGRRRLRLSELPGPVGAGDGVAYHPGPPEPADDPLYLLHTD